MTIYTIGYEGFTLDAFVSALRKYHIDTVIDIREMPLSRKPGFSKTALANVLNLSGLDYEHMVKLGCPKEIRNRYNFLSYLKTQPQAIAALAAVAQSAECALLCYEKDYNFCHRSLVADAVHAYDGSAIHHIGNFPAKKANFGKVQLDAFA